MGAGVSVDSGIADFRSKVVACYLANAVERLLSASEEHNSVVLFTRGRIRFGRLQRGPVSVLPFHSSHCKEFVLCVEVDRRVVSTLVDS